MIDRPRSRFTRIGIHLGVGAGLLLVAATGLAAFRTARASAASAVWAVRAHEMGAAIDALDAQMAAAESARRGFLITGDPGMAADFRFAASEVPAKWRHVRELAEGNALQQRQLDELKPLFERRLERLAASVVSAESGRGDIDQKTLTIQGQADSAAMRTLLGDMLAGEDRRLRERGDEANAAARRVIVRVTGAVVLSMILLATSHVLLAREMGRRDAAEHALQDANRELEAFSYSVSHDLRTPLRGIDGFSQALVEDAGTALPPEAQRHVERIRAATQRMGHLIDDILMLAKVSRADMKPERVDLSDLATQVVAELRRQSPSRHVTVAIAPDLAATGDAPLLRVALENLLDNAWKFTGRRDEATIEVGQTRDNGAVPAFYVRDNGAGFDPVYADKLFGAFQRLHAASEFPGTGVGLATVQRIVRRHGGRVWAEAKPDQGACFYFTLGS